MGDRTVLSMDQTEPSDKELLQSVGECGKDTNLDCRFSIRTDCYHQETAELGTAALHFSTDSVGHCFREDALATSLCGCGLQYEQ